jgi:hypothetical protein
VYTELITEARTIQPRCLIEACKNGGEFVVIAHRLANGGEMALAVRQGTYGIQTTRDFLDDLMHPILFILMNGEQGAGDRHRIRRCF